MQESAVGTGKRSKRSSLNSNLRRLPLASLRVFVAVARQLSFTRAAETLGVTVSAASVQIRGLEEYLGRPLFRRNGRQVQLTAEGAAVLPHIEQALKKLEWAVDSLRSKSGGGPIRVTMLASFLQQWFLRRLARFRSAYPKVDLHLHSSIEPVDFVREEFHVAIRYGGSGTWPHVHAEKLFDEWLLPVCTPALHAKCGPIQQRDDIRRYPLLHSVTEPWTCWLWEAAEQARSGTAPGDRFDDSQAVARIALEGSGLALARWSLVADDISAGLLVTPSRVVIPHDKSYWLVYPPRIRQLAGAEAVIHWLREEAASFPLPARADHRGP